MKLHIYMPEGELAFTNRVAGHEVSSEIAGRGMHSDEARLLLEFSEAEGVPDTLGDGRLRKVAEGVSKRPDLLGVPYVTYEDVD